MSAIEWTHHACPRCGDVRDNLEARHPRDERGRAVEFRSIVLGCEESLCDPCLGRCERPYTLRADQYERIRAYDRAHPVQPVLSMNTMRVTCGCTWRRACPAHDVEIDDRPAALEHALTAGPVGDPDALTRKKEETVRTAVTITIYTRCRESGYSSGSEITDETYQVSDDGMEFDCSEEYDDPNEAEADAEERTTYYRERGREVRTVRQ